VSETFQIIHVPDGQKQSGATWLAIMQWIVDHATSNNIKLVSIVGDLIENTASTPEQAATEYGALAPATDLLYGIVPFGILPGNHDLRAPSAFKTAFPISGVSGYSWFRSATEDGLSYAQTFVAGGIPFIHLSIKYGPWSAGATIQWAQGILEEDPTAKVILSTHSYINTDGSLTAEGQIIFDELVTPYADQIFLVLCGHMHGVYHRVDTIAGHQVDTLLADYQAETVANGGNGFIRILTLTV
jgi:hypothetical protein